MTVVLVTDYVYLLTAAYTLYKVYKCMQCLTSVRVVCLFSVTCRVYTSGSMLLYGM